MMKILFTRPDGGLTVLSPVQGARLAFRVNDAVSSVAKPVDTFLRGWPVEGATVEWAETEDEFVERIRQKDVPATATQIRIVDSAEIPADRAERAAWWKSLNV